ncbi:hypothetical protein FB45DRAFT_862254 [Roridomyces roridus]|uniref:Uncharacterized protein n=1 Tax=Roridomyces roridus TaxID=1738132 RepID=A0AAD7C711_9AGAR|nr:hypothetical protein FB45DRAFT_862254 [Roridomyces roridus]
MPTSPKRDLAVYQYLPPYHAPRLPDVPLRNYTSFAPKEPPPLNRAIDEFVQCLDRITSNTRLALCDFFYVIREIRPRVSWVDSSDFPDLCTVNKLHNTYMNLLGAMDTVHFACAKYFLALRAESESTTTHWHDAVQGFRSAFKCVAEHIARVEECWDEATAELSEYLPPGRVERFEQLLRSGIHSESYNRYPAERNKVLSLLPSLRASAQSQAAVLEDLYEELEKDIMFVDAERQLADISHANLNVALAALIWQEWGLVQYREDTRLARRWEWDARPSNFATTNLINEEEKHEP